MTTQPQPSIQDFPRIYPIQEQLRFLVRYAILAPSTRNTQPWRFRVDRDRIEVRADLSRLQSVADRDRRELYLSLGCAIENLLVAAEQFGFRHTAAYLPAWPDEEVAATIAFRTGGRGSLERRGLTLQTLLVRRAAHGRFTDQPLSAEDVAALRTCAVESDLELSWVTDPERRRTVQGLHRLAHEIALADPAFREELADWVGQGAFGTPWPLAQIGRVALAREKVAHRLARFDAIAVGSAPLLVLISSRDDDRPSQIRSGQLLERLWLAATARGLGLQPLSATLEVPRLRTRLSHIMEARLPWPQQLVRIGHPGETGGHRTPRRPLGEVLDPPEPVL
jgi:nitroreductase